MTHTTDTTNAMNEENKETNKSTDQKNADADYLGFRERVEAMRREMNKTEKMEYELHEEKIAEVNRIIREREKGQPKIYVPILY